MRQIVLTSFYVILLYEAKNVNNFFYLNFIYVLFPIPALLQFPFCVVCLTVLSRNLLDFLGKKEDSAEFEKNSIFFQSCALKNDSKKVYFLLIRKLSVKTNLVTPMPESNEDKTEVKSKIIY